MIFCIAAGKIDEVYGEEYSFCDDRNNLEEAVSVLKKFKSSTWSRIEVVTVNGRWDICCFYGIKTGCINMKPDFNAEVPEHDFVFQIGNQELIARWN